MAINWYFIFIHMAHCFWEYAIIIAMYDRDCIVYSAELGMRQHCCDNVWSCFKPKIVFIAVCLYLFWILHSDTEALIFSIFFPVTEALLRYRCREAKKLLWFSGIFYSDLVLNFNFSAHLNPTLYCPVYKRPMYIVQYPGNEIVYFLNLDIKKFNWIFSWGFICLYCAWDEAILE